MGVVIVKTDILGTFANILVDTPFFQYEFLAHCERDEDCDNKGKCVLEPNSLVVKTCYCAYGFFGQNCRQRESFITFFHKLFIFSVQSAIGFMFRL